jgi:hypothetical protein
MFFAKKFLKNSSILAARSRGIKNVTKCKSLKMCATIFPQQFGDEIPYNVRAEQLSGSSLSVSRECLTIFFTNCPYTKYDDKLIIIYVFLFVMFYEEITYIGLKDTLLLYIKIKSSIDSNKKINL